MTIIFSTEKHGFCTTTHLATNIFSDLKNNYFKEVDPLCHRFYLDNGTFIFEPPVSVDASGSDHAGNQFTNPKLEADTWRIAFTVSSSGTIEVKLGTFVQVKRPKLGIYRSFWNYEQGLIKFINRKQLTPRPRFDLDMYSIYTCTYPMSYALSISDHGVFLAVWDDGFDEFQDEKLATSPSLQWLLVQRPVTKEGTPYYTGRKPVMCVYTTCNAGYIIAQNMDKPPDASIPYGSVDIGVNFSEHVQVHKMFTVYEQDIIAPSDTKLADFTVEDSCALFNSNSCVGSTEAGNTLFKFIQGFNTTRNFYDLDLDMLAFASAETTAQGSNETLTRYEEPRQYRGLPANRLKNTGMRVFYHTADENFPWDRTQEDAFIAYLTFPPIPRKLFSKSICEQAPVSETNEWEGGTDRSNECFQGYVLYVQSDIKDCSLEIVYLMQAYINIESSELYDFEIVGCPEYTLYIDCYEIVTFTNPVTKLVAEKEDTEAKEKVTLLEDNSPNFFTHFIEAGVKRFTLTYKRSKDTGTGENYGYVGFIMRYKGVLKYYTRKDIWKSQIGITEPLIEFINPTINLSDLCKTPTAFSNGGYGIDIRNIQCDVASTIGISYDMYGVPDKIEVFINGVRVYNSDFVSSTGEAIVTVVKESLLTIRLESITNGSSWEYGLSCK